MIPVICCSSFEYCQPLGAGAFCRVFTTNVSPQCRAFSRASEIKKLKALLFRGLEGAGDTNDWCIILVEQHHEKTGFCIYEKTGMQVSCRVSVQLISLLFHHIDSKSPVPLHP